MKLGEVFQSMQAWQALTTMKMSPAMAYSLLKYAKLVSAEYDIAEKQRVALIHELTNTVEGQDARIEPGTKESKDYVDLFSAILELECDLVPCWLKFEDVLEAINEEQASVLSARDLGLLEPFFAREG